MLKRCDRVVLVGLIVAGFVVAAGSAEAQSPVISEVMASNKATLFDEDGNSSDWAELFNPTDSPISLEGWYFSDDPRQLEKWRFPAVEIPPFGHLMVFCSGKDRADPDSELHTNFRIDSDGEFLALVEPDGITPASAILGGGTQLPDVSYGIAIDSTTMTLVGDGASLRYLVPTETDAGVDWQSPAFDDGAWTTAEFPIGYDRRSTPQYVDGLIRTNLEEQLYRVNSTLYLRIPFQVADPSSIHGFAFRVRYDDGFVAYLNGEEITRQNARDELDWEARAVRRRQSADVLQPQLIDLTTHTGKLLQGDNILAVHVLNDRTSSSSFLFEGELFSGTINSVDTSKLLYFSQSTPNFPNGDGLAALTAPPETVADDGAFSEAFLVAFTHPLADTEIRYTVDGTPPTAESTLYTEPLSIEETTTVRVRAFREGEFPSEIVTRRFLRMARTLHEFDSNLPLIAISGAPPPALNETSLMPHMIQVFEPKNGRASFSTRPDFAGFGGIRLRGSSSLSFAKKNYALEIWDEEVEDDIAVSLLGMAPDSDWILHGPYSDKSLMRNALAYKWSNDIGEYATRTRFVELFMATNGAASMTTSHQLGVYVFMEKIKINPERVDIEKLYPSDDAEPEISGGYILKNDRLDPGDAGFRTARGKLLAFVWPKERDGLTQAQRQWITNYLDEFETALNGPSFADPEEGYEKYIDVDSFIDHHIIVELTKNIDGYRLSTFMTKDRGGKLRMGPVWDYNLSLGNADYNNGWLPSGWYYSIYQNSYQEYPWYPRLFQDPNFVKRYAKRWQQHRADALSNEKLLGSIEDFRTLLRESQERNFRKWRVLGTRVWPNWFIARTWDAEIDWMSNWLVDRVAWMDEEFVLPPEFNHPGGEIRGTTIVEITKETADGVIYYTLDGEDPRARASAVADSAVAYTGPLEVSSNTKIVARILYGERLWSPLAERIFVTDLPTLAVTEIHYNPLESDAFSSTDHEFIEFYNFGTEPVGLTELEFARGVRFDFRLANDLELAPGEYGVMVQDLEAFAARYDTADINVLGAFSGSLSNAGEQIEVTTALAGGAGDFGLIDFRYTDDWYPTTDGEGNSLVLLDPKSSRSTWGNPEAWAPSSAIHGTPGRADPGVAAGGRIVQGDVTLDSHVNIIDAIAFARYLFRSEDGSGMTLPCGAARPGEENGDANAAFLDVSGDGRVDLTDVVYLMNYSFLRGPEPALGSGCTTLAGCNTICE